ncbi:hypothetical protein ACVWXO_009701 [Bradyrhizobium sp. LM2.7]
MGTKQPARHRMSQTEVRLFVRARAFAGGTMPPVLFASCRH